MFKGLKIALASAALVAVVSSNVLAADEAAAPAAPAAAKDAKAPAKDAKDAKKEEHKEGK